MLGFGYSQSGRLLREFVRDGFNQDEHGRAAFDGLMIASAGAGGGSFNHRFAMPGQAGNSVLSILRPVDLPPFTDAGLLARARTDGVVPRIFYTFSSTEYWARAGSLTHTTDDGKADLPPDPSSRLYFLAGTPHASGPLPPLRETGSQQYRHELNFGDQRWVLARCCWISTTGCAPARSRHPRATRQCARRARRAARHLPSRPVDAARYLPPVWRMDFGSGCRHARDHARTARLGRPVSVLVPQVNADGNDIGGIPLPKSRPLSAPTPVGTSPTPLTGLSISPGWSVRSPFAATREAAGRGRRAPVDRERYGSRQAYLAAVDRAVRVLVQQRLMLGDDAGQVRERAAATWDAVVER